MRPSEIERLLLDHGWTLLEGRGKGSHRVYVHQDHPRERIVIPWHNREVSKGTERSILRKAGLS
jgi:predicted RNA binding protein YcfA (HicA-like mRNA interferase family)